MSQSELARRMNRPVKTINEIVNGKAAITPDTAIQLEWTLGISASFWNGIESLYREQLARRRAEADLEREGQWAELFPVTDLARHGLIRSGRSQADRVAAILRYFGVGSPSAWENEWLAPAAALRESPVFQSSPYAIAAWLRWGESSHQVSRQNRLTRSVLCRFYTQFVH